MIQKIEYLILNNKIIKGAKIKINGYYIYIYTLKNHINKNIF